MDNKFTIGFFGSLAGVGTDCGYGYSAVQLIEAWQRQRVPVWWGKEDSPIAISMCQPTFYDGSPNQYRIGYTPWESTSLPFGWLHNMNMMNEIWTTSEACKRWFRYSGVYRPIRVLHHGINRQHFPLKIRKIEKDEPFTFLHIGEPTKRKGGQLVYEAFKDSFGDRSDINLIIKGKTNIKIKENNVRVIRDYISQKELKLLYLNSHAMIYPSNGEGFGLIPFQAAASGMPTACTDWGGHQDFMKFCFPIKIDGEVQCDYEPHTGMWAQPNYNSVRYWMESFVDSPNYFFKSAYRKANQMIEWTWDAVAEKSLGWMRESLVKLQSAT